MMKKIVLIRLVNLFLFVLILVSSAETASGADTLKIGAIWGLTGPGSTVQIVKKDGSLTAMHWINSKGGITVGGKKYQIEVLVEDNKNSPTGCVSAATKLIHQDKVKFITGMVVPVQYEAVQSVTEKNKVLLVIGRATYLTPKTPFSFSASIPLMSPYPGIYDYLRETYPSAKKVAFPVNDELGAQTAVKFARDIAKERGFTLLDNVVHPYEMKDFYPVWTKLLEQRPDVVDIGLNLPVTAAANVRQGRELGFKGPIISPLPIEPNAFLRMVGKDLATEFFCSGFNQPSPQDPPMMREIASFWKQKYGKPFDLSAHEGVDAVWCLAQAIEEAQSFDPETVMKAWENMRSIETIWGPATMGGTRTFGINHTVVHRSALTSLMNGEIKFIRWLDIKLP